jgi:hypothetical protein
MARKECVIGSIKAFHVDVKPISAGSSRRDYLVAGVTTMFR